MSRSTAGKALEFNDGSDLVGAPVETLHGSGIVRAIAKPVTGDTHTNASAGTGCINNSNRSSASARPVLLVDLKEDTNARTGDDSGSSTFIGDERATATTGEEALITTAARRRVLRVTVAELIARPACAPGSCVQTTLGTGVLIDFRPTDGIHVVRLWRPRGAGSALAYLNRDALLRKLPAAVGVRVVTPEGEGVVLGFVGGAGRGDGVMCLVELAADGTTVLVDGKSVSCPVAKVCTAAVQAL